MKLSDLVVPNDAVACEPFPQRTTAQHAQVPGARAKAVSTPGGQGTVLIPLRVLASNWDRLLRLPEATSALIRPGDRVFVHAEDCIQPWANAHKIEGIDQPLIIVPIRSIKLIEHDQAGFEAAIEAAPPARLQLGE